MGFRMLLIAICLLLLGVCDNVMGDGKIEVHFLHYSDNCGKDWLSKCDPMFSFCLSTPQSGSPTITNCDYASTGESDDHFQDENDINLEHRSVAGHSNPWIVSVPQFRAPSVMLVIQVRDHDIFDSREHMQTMGEILTLEVYPAKEKSQWHQSVMSKNSYKMTYKIRMYCDPYYHTSKCNVYCKPEDSNAGHYTCNSTTGEKICLHGWQGSQCSEDINECNFGYCINNSTCNNTPGNYMCICPPNYTDKNCGTLMNPCRIQPCLNGGTCYSHNSEHIYKCLCLPDWEGENCEIKKLPCKSQPCRNNNSCTDSADGASYICNCAYPYTGIHCESYIERAMTTTPSTEYTTSTSVETTATSFTTTFAANGTTSISEPSTTINILEDATSTTPIIQAHNEENVQHLVQEADNSSFQPWYIAIILAALIIVLVIIIVVLIKRRRQKMVQIVLPPISPPVFFDGHNAAFENNMYTDVNRNNLEFERQARQLPPVPATSADDELLNPIKPTYAMISETKGAEGGSKADESDPKKKSANTLEKTTDSKFDSLTRPETNRAQTNPYADFKTLRDSQMGNNKPKKDDHEHQEESHYHDLDEIAASVSGSLDANEPDGRSDDTLILDIQTTPIVSVQFSPYDSPPNNASYYDVPSGGIAQIPSLVPQRTNAQVVDDIDSTDEEDDNVMQEDIEKLRQAVKDNMEPVNPSET